MIQDIDEKLRNEFHWTEADENDEIFIFKADTVLIRHDETEGYSLPRSRDVALPKKIYLFSIGSRSFFLAETETDIFPAGYEYINVRDIRSSAEKELAFAAATAYHLFQWYRDNRFCGRCGKRLVHDHTERMLKCPECGNMVFPKIAPAVIVGVTDGDRILFTKYSGRAYKRYALIAGFTEIGETAEETVAREVMEEVGLKVRNIRYYKSQPWGTDCNLLMGFFAELDGDNHITLDHNELSEAEWIKRDEIDAEDDGISLTREMMHVFKNGKERGK